MTRLKQEQIHAIQTETEYELYDEHGQQRTDLRVVKNIPTSQSKSYRDSLGKQVSITYEQFEQSQVSNINDACFIFMIYTPVQTFIEKYSGITKGDYARLVYLSTFLQQGGTRLKKDTVNFVKAKDIKEMLGVPDRTAKLFLQRTKEAGVLFSDTDDYINISSEVFINGRPGRSTKTRKYTRIFIENTRHLYHAYKKGKAIEKLGTLYALIPYIDYRTNILCANANEDITEVSELTPLNRKDIARILGHSDESRVLRTLSSLAVTIGGITFSLFQHTALLGAGRESFVVSPFFVYPSTPSKWLFEPSHTLFLLEIKAQLDEHQRQAIEDQQYKTIVDSMILTQLNEEETGA